MKKLVLILSSLIAFNAQANEVEQVAKVATIINACYAITGEQQYLDEMNSIGQYAGRTFDTANQTAIQGYITSNSVATMQMVQANNASKLCKQALNLSQTKFK